MSPSECESEPRIATEGRDRALDASGFGPSKLDADGFAAGKLDADGFAAAKLDADGFAAAKLDADDPVASKLPVKAKIVTRFRDGRAPDSDKDVSTAVPDASGHADDSETHALQRDRMAALGTLSAGVAHEINNPLTYVLVNCEHVLRRLRAVGASRNPTAELIGGAPGGLTGLVQALEHAVEGATRIRRVVGDLLTFAQGNVERVGLVDVRGILESATQLAWHEIRHRARLSKNLAAVPLVVANEACLGQVFLNLLINAARAIPEGQADRHEVRVATNVDQDGNVVVEVSDTGIGIASEDLPRVFDPFFRANDGEGTGLGLAVSHGTVQRLGGTIQVTSVPGQGSTFRVILRRAEWPVPPVRAGASETRRRTLRKRVLLIDDEQLVGQAIARGLSMEHEVEVVTEARVALERMSAGNDRYDVVLCDLMMPVMTGMDLYSEVLRSDPKLASRFIFMTGGAFSARGQAFLQSVANPCLEKPIDLATLRSLMGRIQGGQGLR